MALIGFRQLIRIPTIVFRPLTAGTVRIRGGGARPHFVGPSRYMVTLVVATTIDPASIGPASALLAMPGWHPGPPVQDMASFVNGGVRLLKHDKSIVREDHLDKRWEEATGEVVKEVIFLSKHAAASNRPALTVHPIGVPHLCENEVPPAGGRPGWAAPPNPRMGPWLRLLQAIAESHNLTPEFEVTLEATHHGPEIDSPSMFVEIGSTEEYWKRQDAAQAIALLVWEGLGLGEGAAVGDWNRNNVQNKILLGIGGGHYASRHMPVALKDGVWVGHILAGHSLPMEVLGQSEQMDVEAVGGTWREAIRVAFESTTAAFPEGEVLAHLDRKLVCLTIYWILIVISLTNLFGCLDFVRKLNSEVMELYKSDQPLLSYPKFYSYMQSVDKSTINLPQKGDEIG